MWRFETTEEDEIEEMVRELAKKREQLLNRGSGAGDPQFMKLEEALSGGDASLGRLARAALDAIPGAGSIDDGSFPEGEGFVKKLAEVAGAVGKTPSAKESGRDPESLIRDLSSDDAMVRSQSIAVLGRMGAQAVGPLVGALSGNEPSIRTGATMALGIIGGPAVQPLISALKNKEWDVRRRAAKALGWIGDRRAEEPLLGLLKDRNQFVRLEAAEALLLTGGVEAREAAAKYIDRVTSGDSIGARLHHKLF